MLQTKKMIVTLNDPQNRPSIGDLLKEKRIKHRIFPVGRLDWDAEGLLILTSDGELANQIMHPKNRLPKVYIVEVIGRPAENSLEKLRNGIFIEPGVKTKAAQIAVLKNYLKKTILKVTIFEGRKNQIKKMFSRVGHFVIAIKRIAIGQLNLSGLNPGDVRPLSGTEIRELKKRVEKVIT